MNNSVIIPIYNVADRLLLCLDSLVTAFRLVRQAHPEFLAEVICVDDGSTDESGEILDPFVRETNIEGLAFKAFHQNNAGVSAARNTGLEKVLGEWITFIDPDDAVASDYLSKVADEIALADSDLDLVITNARVEEVDGRSHLLEPNAPERKLIENDVLGECWNLRVQELFGVVWNKFVRNTPDLRSFRFVEGVSFAEDGTYSECVAAKTEKALLLGGVVGYHYKRRVQSLMSSWSVENILGGIDLAMQKINLACTVQSSTFDGIIKSFIFSLYTYAIARELPITKRISYLIRFSIDKRVREVLMPFLLKSSRGINRVIPLCCIYLGFCGGLLLVLKTESSRMIRKARRRV